MKLVPSSDSSVLGDRIDIMNNAVSSNNQFKTNVAYINGNTEVGFQRENFYPLADWLLMPKPCVDWLRACSKQNQFENPHQEKLPDTFTLEEGRLHDAPHVFGLFWTKDKLEWYFDGQKIRSETGKSPQVPLFWQLESEIIENLNQGVDSATNWPEYCEFEYVRHFALDDVNEACMPKDKAEQEKCEKMYEGQEL